MGDIDPAGLFGASWSTRGTIAFVPETSSPIQQISDSGGNPQPLTRLEKGQEAGDTAPQFLPGNKDLLFVYSTARFPATRRTIATLSLQTGERRDLLQVQGDANPRYASTGHLVFGQGLSLMAAPFNVRQLKLSGAAVSVIEGVLPTQFDFSSTGTLVYVPGSALQLKLVWVDRKGKEEALPAPPHNYVQPRISPDGKRVAAGIEEQDNQIWLYDLGRDTLTRLTFEGSSNVDPVWSPDGKKIVFKGKQNRLFWQPADGSGPAEELTKNELYANNVPGSFSSDGQILVFAGLAFPQRAPAAGDVGNAPEFGLYTLSLKDGKPQPFLLTPSTQTAPRFSPDGHFIAYASVESGHYEIYVRSYPGPGGKWQVSTEGGTEPVWNPRGHELFYRNGTKMMAVDVNTQGAFSAGKPRMLFEGPYVPTPRSFQDYDVSPDGERFLMLKPAEQQSTSPTQIVVVQNWFEELKRRVPGGVQ